MTLKSHALTAALALVLAAPALAHAETAAQMEANKKLVLEFYRNSFEPQRLEVLKDYYDPNIIEHNPNVASTLQGFASTMGARWVAKPVPATLKNPPAIVTTDGDLVTLVFKRTRPEPSDASKTYEVWWFDMFRVKNGKITEHWDAATKPAGPPAGAPPRP